MSEFDSESAALKRDVEDAFANVPYPGDRGPDLCQTSDPIEEAHQVEILGGKRWPDWKERPIEALGKGIHDPELSFLTDEAFRYYLPLFMFAAAFHNDEADVIPSSLVRALTRPENPNSARAFEERMREFTPQQLKAIMSFLLHIRRHYQQPHLKVWLVNVNKAIVSIESLLTPRSENAA